MNIKPKFNGNMKTFSVRELISFVEGVPGGYVECDADQLSAVRRPPEQGNVPRRTWWPRGWLRALKAPANRSQLVGMEFMVLHAIGRNVWNRGSVLSHDPADHFAEAEHRWGQAMAAMQDFYQQAAKRKGIVL